MRVKGRGLGLRIWSIGIEFRGLGLRVKFWGFRWGSAFGLGCRVFGLPPARVSGIAQPAARRYPACGV